MQIQTNEQFGFDFSFVLQDYTGKKHYAQICEKKEYDDRTVYELKSDDKNLKKLNLFVIKGDGYICIGAEAKYETSAGWAIKNTFSPKDCIKIELFPSDVTADVMGSYYSLSPESDCWASAFSSKKLTDIPNDAASLLWKQNETYYHMLPLCDGDFKAKIQKNSNKSLCLAITSDMGGYSYVNAKAAVITWGKNPFELPEKTAEHGFELLGLRRKLRKDKRLPDMFKYLGWCTWDAFKKDLNEQGITEKAHEFRKKKVPVKWILLDDGWFEFADDKLLSITEDKRKFPSGLKSLIEALKCKYGIAWVGVWQCFMGYWSGIHPKSSLTADMKEYLFKTNSGYIIPRFDEEGCMKFWNIWNDYLSKQGVDFVKTDVENALAAYTYNHASVGKTAHESHRGFEASVDLFYDGACINCTGMSHESIWNRFSGAINRNSSDFIPTDIETMPQFVYDNICNSFYHSLFYYTDWDMMWTNSPTTKLNTVMHAVSGSLLYISDKVGETNPSVVMPFVTAEGLLLTCDDYGVPVHDSLFVNPTKEKVLFKAQNCSGESGVEGIFNLCKNTESICGNVSPSDIKYFSKTAADEYLAFSWYSKNVQRVKYNEQIEISLPPYSAELYTFYPVKKDLTIIGLIDKYIPQAAVIKQAGNEMRKIIHLADGGNFAYRCDRKHEVFANGNKVCAKNNGEYMTIDCNEYHGDIIIEIIMNQ